MKISRIIPSDEDSGTSVRDSLPQPGSFEGLEIPFTSTVRRPSNDSAAPVIRKRGCVEITGLTGRLNHTAITITSIFDERRSVRPRISMGDAIPLPRPCNEQSSDRG